MKTNTSSELGMVKHDEVFYQILDNASAPKIAQPVSAVAGVGQH